MELKTLEYFLAVAQEGSISGAAEVLHVSQPTLSRQLKELEDELGCTLFTRGRRGVTLTDDGLLLRRRASEIVDLARITQNEIMLNQGVVEGEVRIGCAETQAMDLLAQVMLGFQRDHPKVVFIISSDLAENVAEQIEHGLVDFGLLLRVNDAWNLDYRKLPTNERAVVVMPEDSPLAEHASLTFDDLGNTPLLIPSSYGRSGLLGGELPRYAGGRLNVVVEFGFSYNATRMVRAGMGAMITLEGLVETPPGSGLVQRPLEIEVEMPSYLAWKPFSAQTRACDAFLERVREEL